MKRILLLIACVVLLGMSWIAILSIKPEMVDQEGLINTAAQFMEDKAYASAIPLLEEAVKHQTDRTASAEEMLKNAYLNVTEFKHKYPFLLNSQILKYGLPALYMELSVYYLDNGQIQRALNVLKAGIEETGDNDLVDFYERERYAYKEKRMPYDYIEEIYNNGIAVMKNGFWGITNNKGILIIPCMYEKISTFSNGTFVVKLNGEIFTINSKNQRTALLKESAIDFGNLGQGLLSIQTEENVWRRATFKLDVGTTEFEEFGMYSGGYAAAKINGKWGVISTGSEYLIPPEHDGIIMDSLGRCYGQGAVFVKEKNNVRLTINGHSTEYVYDDARPFNSSGWAAVMKDGKWGFIDTTGKLLIEYSFNNAQSFSGQLAAVEIDGLWGYISNTGKLVIEPQYIQAKSFVDGNALVQNESGWLIISLLE